MVINISSLTILSHFLRFCSNFLKKKKLKHIWLFIKTQILLLNFKNIINIEFIIKSRIYYTKYKKL